VVVQDAVACQEECQKVKGCATFSFWTKGGHCHLQDKSASRQQYGFGYESGHRECSKDDLVTQTTTNPIPENERCIQDGLIWSPLLAPMVKFEGVSEDEAAVKCQQMCADEEKCARFQFDPSTRECGLASTSADPMLGKPGILSGPPACDELYSALADFILSQGGFQRPADSMMPSREVWDKALEQDMTQAEAEGEVSDGDGDGDDGGDGGEDSSGCLEEHLVWEPSMAFARGLKAETRRQSVTACQKLCAATSGCRHFVANFADDSCRLAGSDALPLESKIDAVSGPPTCAASMEFLRKYRKQGRSPSRGSWSLMSLAGGTGATMMISLSLVSLCLLLPVACWAATRRGPSTSVSCAAPMLRRRGSRQDEDDDDSPTPTACTGRRPHREVNLACLTFHTQNNAEFLMSRDAHEEEDVDGDIEDMVLVE